MEGKNSEIERLNGIKLELEQVIQKFKSAEDEKNNLISKNTILQKELEFGKEQIINAKSVLEASESKVQEKQVFWIFSFE